MIIDIEKLERLEVINHADNKLPKGRYLVAYEGKEFKKLSFSIQDDDKTLKIFLE